MSWFSKTLRARTGRLNSGSRLTAAAEAASILTSLRDERFERLRAKYGGEEYSKYFNFAHFIPFNVRLCCEIGLVNAPRQKIVDIGCGSGLFLYCAKHFGHDGIGLDIENDLFAEMTRYPRRKSTHSSG